LQTISGIPDNDLHLVIDDLRCEGAPIISIDRDSEGYWSVVFTAPPAQIPPDNANTETVASPPQPGPPPDNDGSKGQNGPVTAARKIGPQMILYLRSNGQSFVRAGGSRAWRNSNPGNIRMGDFASAHGAVGDDGDFAIFADEATGMAAIVALLATNSYSSLSLREAIHRYAPPVENDSDAYVDAVVRDTGIAPAARLDSLDNAQIHALATAIGTIEGWREGDEYEYGADTQAS
jgi:hypothetical protein